MQSPLFETCLSAHLRTRTAGKAGPDWMLRWTLRAALLVAVRMGSVCAGCQETPELEAKTVGKMGLKGTPGLRLMSKEGAAARAQQRYGSRGPAQGAPVWG